MTEHQPTLLEDLDQTSVGHVPIEQLVAGGRAVKRRKRRAAMAGAIAATALVVGGGTIAGQALTGSSNRPNNDPVAADASKDPARRDDRALGDTRLVGIGEVAITVPTEWASNAASCNTPVRDTYYYPYPQDCVHIEHGRVSSVAIADGPFAEAGIGLDGLRPAGQLGGYDVVESEAICELRDPGSCTQTFAISDLDAYFHVTVDTEDGGEATLATIRDSLTVLAVEQTVIPFVPYGDPEKVVNALNTAGFTVITESDTCPPNASCLDGVTTVEPAVGTVVATGSTVTVTVLEN